MGYLLGLSIVLRLVLLNQSLWLDESIQALALMGRMGPLLTYALADYQPPLYHLLGYLTTQVFGYSEVALRLPSLIAGVLTVYFVTKIGQEIGSKKTGFIAGLLAATNPLLIYYSQEGRTYALTTFLVTASFYYFLQILNNRKSSKLLPTAYFLFTTAFLWTSYLSWFVLVAQGLYVIWKRRYDLLLLQVCSALTLLAWLPSFITSLGIGQSTRSGSPEWGRVVGGLSWKSLPLTWVKFNIGRIGFDNKWLYGALVALIGLLHAWILRRVAFKKYLILLGWGAIPIVLGLATAFILPVYSYFRVLFVLPVYLLLLAIGAEHTSPKIVSLLITIQLACLSIFWFSPRYQREDWRTLVSDLPAGAVLAMPSRAQNAPLLYYGWTSPIIEPSHENLTSTEVYYIRYVEDLFDPRHLGQANFNQSGYTITKQKVFTGIQLDVYEKK